MSSDNSNPPGPQPEGMGFTAVDAISPGEKPLCEVLSCILEHEEMGIPLVIRGLDTDPNWSPLPELGPPEEGGNLGHQSSGREKHL